MKAGEGGDEFVRMIHDRNLTNTIGRLTLFLQPLTTFVRMAGRGVMSEAVMLWYNMETQMDFLIGKFDFVRRGEANEALTERRHLWRQWTEHYCDGGLAPGQKEDKAKDPGFLQDAHYCAFLLDPRMYQLARQHARTAPSLRKGLPRANLHEVRVACADRMVPYLHTFFANNAYALGRAIAEWQDSGETRNQPGSPICVFL